MRAGPAGPRTWWTIAETDHQRSGYMFHWKGVNRMLDMSRTISRNVLREKHVRMGNGGLGSSEAHKQKRSWGLKGQKVFLYQQENKTLSIQFRNIKQTTPYWRHCTSAWEWHQITEQRRWHPSVRASTALRQVLSIPTHSHILLLGVQINFLLIIF